MGEDLIGQAFSGRYVRPVGGWVRYWTVPERNEIFERYFDASPVSCPVCAQSLGFRMNHTRDVVTLSVRCENCGNTAVLFFSGLIGLPAEKLEHNF